MLNCNIIIIIVFKLEYTTYVTLLLAPGFNVVANYEQNFYLMSSFSIAFGYCKCYHNKRFIFEVFNSNILISTDKNLISLS